MNPPADPHPSSGRSSDPIPLPGSFADLEAEFRRLLYEHFTPDHARMMMRRLVARAMDGHIAAAKLVLLYTVGPPPTAEEVARAEAEAFARRRPCDEPSEN